MKKFSAFVKTNLDRKRHLSWDDGDIIILPGLEEWTADKPLKLKTDSIGRADIYRNRTKDDDPHRYEFSEHHQNLSNIHHEHMSFYKGDSYSTNHYLRHGKMMEHSYTKEPHVKDHIAKMDHVTSYRTKHWHMTFRGGVPSDLKKFRPGHQFQDHGYTGTSFRHSVAADFSNPHQAGTVTSSNKRIVHVIHSPPGTKAHFIDIDHRAGNALHTEQEMVLHRGTKFKVTHHSEDRDHHYIHSRVIGHNPKKIDMSDAEPGPHHSKTAHALHNSVIMTKHEDEKNPEIKAHFKPKIKIRVNPEHLAAAKKAAAEHKKKQIISKSMENAKK